MEQTLQYCDFCGRSEVTPILEDGSEILLKIHLTDSGLWICVDCEED